MSKQFFFWLLIAVFICFRILTSRPDYKEGDKIRVTGVVYSDPQNFPTSTFVKLAGLKIYLPALTQIFYGDTLVVEGTSKKGVLEDPKIVTIKSGKFLSFFRNKIIDFYQKALPQPESGLLAGMVLGAKGALDPEFYNLTKSSGVAHVVVASGTNVTFVVSFVSGIVLIFLPRRWSIPFVIVGIILYLFIAGFDAPLIRAAIMACIIFLAQATGRLVAAFRVFLLTGAVMIMVNPDWISDIGFLLSFASTGALMVFEKRIRALLSFLPGFFKESLSTSLAAQMGVGPILFVTFGQFNIWSPLINTLVLWTVPPLMIIGCAGGIIGLILPLAGKAILWMGYPLLWWFVQIIKL